MRILSNHAVIHGNSHNCHNSHNSLIYQNMLYRCILKLFFWTWVDRISRFSSTTATFPLFWRRRAKNLAVLQHLQNSVHVNYFYPYVLPNYSYLCEKCATHSKTNLGNPKIMDIKLEQKTFYILHCLYYAKIYLSTKNPPLLRLLRHCLFHSTPSSVCYGTAFSTVPPPPPVTAPPFPQYPLLRLLRHRLFHSTHSNFLYYIISETPRVL